MVSPVNVAVVGATGAVGECMLKVLEERDFPIGEIYLLASERSVGKQARFRGRDLKITELAAFDFSRARIALFSAGASISEEHVPRAVAAGCVVVDNTSQFRYEDDVPLVVPEVNPEAIARYKDTGIIANPNCSTIQLVVALKPLHDRYRIRRINVATYQAVSGTGKAAIEEMLEQSRAFLEGRRVDSRVYPVQIAFNALPHIDAFMDNGYTKEEMKMVWETRKILQDDQIQVNPTTVRIPVVYGHSEAVHIECAEKPLAQEARALLANAPGISVIDERGDGGYPTAAIEASGCDEVFVGRIREDISHPRGLNLWIVSDNLRKGAATNSIQIAGILLRGYL